MKRILLIFKNDLKRRLKSPLTIIILLITPIAMTALIGLIFSPSENNKLPKIKVLVVDNDKNIASKFLLGIFDSKQLKEMFQVSIVNEREGKKLISKGKASALVLIPEKFSDRLIKAEKTQLLVIKNPSEQFFPTIVEEFMNTLSVVISGFVQVFESELKAVDTLIGSSLEKITIADMTPFMEEGRKKIIRLNNYLNPLLIQLKEEITVKQKKKKEPTFNIFSVILPGLSIMFLLFIIEIFLREILTEREDGKLQRIMFSPIKSNEFIFGRIISGWVMGLLVYLVMIVFGICIFNISWGNYMYLFLFTAVSCFWIASFFALLNSFFKNKNQAGAFTSPIILVFSAFGGSIIQVNQLPDTFQIASHMTINYWFIRGVSKINSGAFPALPFLIILISGIILFFMSVKFLKNRISV